jgi:hypothetical protein
MQPQFITDTKGKKISAVLPIKDFEMILDQFDELACIKEYDKAKAKKNQQFISLKDAFRQVEKTRRK